MASLLLLLHQYILFGSMTVKELLIDMNNWKKAGVSELLLKEVKARLGPLAELLRSTNNDGYSISNIDLI